MKILEYDYHDAGEPGWSFDTVKFNKINLLVGDTATGKSRLLNTIFNFGRFVGAGETKIGDWHIVFDHSGITYKWNLKCQDLDNDNKGVIVEDYLTKIAGTKVQRLIERDDKTFRFGGNPMPKLDRRETSVSILREEKEIRPVFEAFSLIQRRLFSESGLAEVSGSENVPPTVIAQLKNTGDIRKLFAAQLKLSANLYFLKRYFKQQYRRIVDFYMQVFPFIESVDVSELSDLKPHLVGFGPLPKSLGRLPVFTLQERGSSHKVPLFEFSSGMTKVLLILTDLYVLPAGGVYIIDEYENSLGINAIDFFPEFILDFEKDLQFFITSHHPYIINAIPPTNWYLFHRNGTRVSIQHGEELVTRFGSSRQDAFIQLINDPFYSNGVE